jgi:hypothetical protein
VPSKAEKQKLPMKINGLEDEHKPPRFPNRTALEEFYFLLNGFQTKLVKAFRFAKHKCTLVFIATIKSSATRKHGKTIPTRVRKFACN